MWQHVAVLAIVVASTAYAAWSLLPPVTRWRLRRRLVTALQLLPAPLSRLARRLATAQTVSGCASCPASAPHHTTGSRR